MKRLRLHTFVIATLLAVLVGTLFIATKASALSGSEFQAGRIMDDTVFFNRGTLTPQQIQEFLASKVPTCDTNGTEPRGNTTRAAYGTSVGYPPPYICLKDYRQGTTNKPAESGLCNGYTGAPYQSAAEIIYYVAQSCGVSPKALIVLLEKEQSLVTDEWPWSIQYRSATGYGCPDTAPCDAEYYGFFNQVYSAARQFKRYARDAQYFNYTANETNFILYNPNSSCGGTNVFIQNQTTAGLYNYTPYQPNQAALNNLYGGGDGCSAFGNRNFWRLYNDWFGSVYFSRESVTMQTVAAPDTTPARGQTVTYTVSFTNNLSVPITLDAVGIVGRLGDVNNGANRDFGWQGPVTLQPGTAQQFTFTSLIKDNGTIYAWPAISYQGTYAHYNNWGTALTSHAPNIGLSAPLASSIPNPVAGQTATLSATIKNNEDQPIKLEAVGIPVRYYGSYNYDTAWITLANPIQPGATQALSGNLFFDKPGPYTAWVSAQVAGQYATLSPNLNITANKPVPNFQLTYIETPNATPALGEDVTIKFKLKNNTGVPMTLDAVGIVGRYDNPYSGPNRDFGWVGSQSFAVGEEKSYTTFVSNVTELKNFYAWVALQYQGTYTHYNNWGFVMTPHMPNLTISVPLTVNSGAQPAFNQSNSVTATIKNNEPRPIRYNAIGIPIRFYNTYNYDAAWQGSGTLAASGQSGDSKALSGSVFFDKHGPYTLWTSINIAGRYITIGDQKTIQL